MTNTIHSSIMTKSPYITKGVEKEKFMNNNFVRLNKAVVNIDQITLFTTDTVSFTNGETISLSTLDRVKLEKAIFGETSEEVSVPTETTTTTTSLSFYKNLCKKITELNKSKYHKYRVNTKDDVITITQDGFTRMNEYTFDGLCISNGLKEDEIDQAVAECF